MGFRIIVYNAWQDVEQKDVDTIEQAREFAHNFVQDRMDAFGEDREALKDYGFTNAEDQALALSDEGGVVFLPDSWKIEVINDKPED